MAELVLDRKLRKYPELCATLIDNELVLMGPEDQIYYRINASGIKLWEFLDKEPCTVQVAADYVAAYYNLPQDRVLADLQSFFSLLLEKKILEYVD
ncbi:hypothetical protein BN59_01915 [Legionella massiliensis]|uniref:PqqD family protein n=1 Tax=Legionella massiliensis TaxID=1034943 RepID=A0A078KXC4_9GAMM|nr:PqqD family protein [Legionella massiliensis]CDZ77631.1 hypothetical protein BN59_01915 [Legionella massiliensis]CEE13369.1 hypothetical protein BN1094_01915 [Legionella massiliensis]